jgi:hypothetical protein
MDDIRVGPSRQAIFIGDYDRALVSIAAVTEKDLGLPKLGPRCTSSQIGTHFAPSSRRRAPRPRSRATLQP